jgi:NADH dehydrogenase
MERQSNREFPNVVILGAGFGGLRVTKRLAREHVQLTLVDRMNYHLFQPLLYQVAAAYLEPSQIAMGVRTILRAQTNLSFVMAEVTGVDSARRTLALASPPHEIPYDYLVLAPGSVTHFRDMGGVASRAIGLKTLSDSIAIRNRVLSCFEEATVESAERRRGLLTFCIVGGGSAGIEMAGALTELIHGVLLKDYPSMKRSDPRLILAEAGDRLLPEMIPELGEIAMRTLERRGVEVLLGRPVTDFTGSEVLFADGSRIAAHTLIWTAGVKAAPISSMLGTPLGPLGRVPVDPTLRVPANPRIFVIGDAAFVNGDGGVVPMVAPAAVQMADVAAENILRDIAGKPPVQFVYKNPGQLATIGRNAAVAYVWGIRWKGILAWLMWLVVHLVRLIGFRNRLMVLIGWSLDYFFHERAVRIIDRSR